MRRLIALVFASLASALLAASGAVAAEPPQIHEFELDNGLKLIVRPDRRAPVAVSQIWYRVGSSYESPGITGVSHALEHMMFKGTDTYPPGEFSRIIALNGGRENAFTGRDYTAYYQQLSNDRLELSFELEADRMRNIRLSEEEFAKEIQVVMEERRLRTEDKPISLAMEQFYTVAFPVSPYRNPVIGWMSDLRHMQLADLQRWYERWYTPNNALLVVAGDVEPEAVRELAEKHFGPIPARPLPELKPALRMESPGARRLVLRRQAELPFLSIGYPVPSAATAEEDWEPYALLVLSGILDGGQSARLPSRLVRGQRVAAAISASYSLVSRLDTLFSFSAYPAGGKTHDELEQAILAEVERLRSEPVPASELERAKNQIIADHLYQMDSVFYQAMQIGLLETTGIGWRSLLDFENRVNAVTAEQVKAVAEKYLSNDNRATLHLIPIAKGDEKQ